MPFKDTPEGTTHYYGDGCGEPAHNPDNHECRAGITCKENPCEHIQALRQMGSVPPENYTCRVCNPSKK